MIRLWTLVENERQSGSAVNSGVTDEASDGRHESNSGPHVANDGLPVAHHLDMAAGFEPGGEVFCLPVPMMEGSFLCLCPVESSSNVPGLR